MKAETLDDDAIAPWMSVPERQGVWKESWEKEL